MRGMLQMLTTATDKDTQDTHVASVPTMLERAFPKPTKASTSNALPVKIIALCAISGEEAEFSNMIRVVGGKR